MTTYQTFAKIYDEVMDETVYEDWLNFTTRHIGDKPKEILELACGTGILSVELANLGHQVVGLDLSKEMIELAKERTTPEDDLLSFEVGDMLDLNKNEDYDVVTCYSDSLCYMPDEEAVQTVFKEVYRSLKSDGTFLFDVHSIFKIEEEFSEYSYHYQTDEFAFLWESYPGDVPYSVEHFLTFFVKEDNQDELFKRYDELHEERTYTIETYQTLLTQAGFSEVIVCADFTDNQPEDESKRWFFICQK
ncbi:class I SAM-dependent DNA methyltransferase [Vagococcus bubulae]|uniref:SAM-dependent methyltransferase n=1 Tax=Vagococcus bubulae TaxID=1977868 RepID=A0A429ZBV2_9ENTE|nr:class I SAM-dependent methyltransferase [Vagococcus bubulae]RST91178.1 SAM-dependent methyltransferase [Vagococcus bubulae]